LIDAVSSLSSASVKLRRGLRGLATMFSIGARRGLRALSADGDSSLTSPINEAKPRPSRE
jgi:hypothetical protein